MKLRTLKPMSSSLMAVVLGLSFPAGASADMPQVYESCYERGSTDKQAKCLAETNAGMLAADAQTLRTYNRVLAKLIAQVERLEEEVTRLNGTD